MPVGLKYTGKKQPLEFHNEHLVQNPLRWIKSGDVIQVCIQDARLMTKDSHYDFEIIWPEDHPEAPMIEMEIEDVPPEEDDILSEEVNMATSEENLKPRKRGRPPKNATEEA